MSLRRGFLRLWIVAAGLWIAGWAWHYAAVCRDFDFYGEVFISGFRCSPPGSYIIEPPKDEPGVFRPVPIKELDIGEIAVTLVGVPLGIFAMGWLIAWIIGGFRSD